MPDLKELFFEALGWVSTVLAIAAALVCFLNRRLSQRMMILTIGFGIDAFVSAVWHVAIFLQNQGKADLDLPLLSRVTQGLYIVASAAIVYGLATVFADLKRRLAEKPYEYRDRKPPPPAPPPPKGPPQEDLFR